MKQHASRAACSSRPRCSESLIIEVGISGGPWRHKNGNELSYCTTSGYATAQSLLVYTFWSDIVFIYAWIMECEQKLPVEN